MTVGTEPLRWGRVASRLVDAITATDRQADQMGDGHMAHSDQVDASMRGFARSFGLDLDDEQTVFTLLAAVELVRAIARDDEGSMCEGVDAALGFAVSNLAKYLPPHVREGLAV